MAPPWTTFVVMACMLCSTFCTPQNSRAVDKLLTFRDRQAPIAKEQGSNSGVPYRPSEQSPPTRTVSNGGGSSTTPLRPASSQSSGFDTRVNEFRPVSTTSSAVKPQVTPQLVSNVAGVWRSIISFALDLDREMYSSGSPNKGGNLGFSPLSVAMALSVLLRGAHEATFREIWKALHLDQAVPGQSLQTPMPPADDIIHAQFRRILDLATNAHNQHQHTGVELKIANALFLNTNYSLKGDFVRDTGHFYDTEIISINMDKPYESVAIINQWVRDKTNGKIPAIFHSPPPATQLLIANAVYFNGAWKYPFPALFTMPRTFEVSENEAYTMPMMQNTVQLRYVDDDVLGCQMAALPYKDELSSMYIILPNKRGIQGLEELEDRMSHTHLDRLISSMDLRDVAISVPRFRLSSQLSLSPVLKRLGMNTLFDYDANLSRVSQTWRLQVGEVKHEAVIDVTEEGTEAAAATAVILTKDGSAKEIRATRPFLFFIRQDQASLVLFWGRVVRPGPVPGSPSYATEPPRPSNVPTRLPPAHTSRPPPVRPGPVRTTTIPDYTTKRLTDQFYPPQQAPSRPSPDSFRPTAATPNYQQPTSTRAPSTRNSGYPEDSQKSQEIIPIQFPDNKN